MDVRNLRLQTLILYGIFVKSWQLQIKRLDEIDGIRILRTSRTTSQGKTSIHHKPLVHDSCLRAIHLSKFSLCFFSFFFFLFILIKRIFIKHSKNQDGVSPKSKELDSKNN